MTRVKLNGTCFSLRRQSDNAGDTGRMLNSINTETKEKTYGEIIVGCVIQCGSNMARSYSEHDYCLTTPVVEIMYVNADSSLVIFRTRNSTYAARAW